MRKILFAAMISCLASGAIAHSKLSSSMPADGAIIAALPATLQLQFHKGIRLTKVTLMSSNSDTVLDLSGYKNFATEFTLAMPTKQTGHYSVEWRGLGEDGHVLKGTVSFQVK